MSNFIDEKQRQNQILTDDTASPVAWEQARAESSLIADQAIFYTGKEKQTQKFVKQTI